MTLIFAEACTKSRMCDPQSGDVRKGREKRTGEIEFNSTETHRADLINFPSFFQLGNARKRRGNLLPLIIVRSLFNHTPKVIRFKDPLGVYPCSRFSCCYSALRGYSIKGKTFCNQFLTPR